MTKKTPLSAHRLIRGESIAAGQRILTPGGTVSAPVRSTAVERDDFGVPALVTATFEDGATARIAVGSAVRVVADSGAGSAGAAGPAGAAPRTGAGPASGSAADTAAATAAGGLIPAEAGTPAAVVADVAAAHPGDRQVQAIADRLSRGLNTKSGSNLQDVRDLVYRLFADLADSANALKVAGLVTDLPFDGNFGRWTSIESCLAIAAYITHEAGEIERSLAYAVALRAPDNADTDPLRAKVNAIVRQRHLNEPNLYDREVNRAAAAGDRNSEQEWRRQRLGTLMYLRTHGGSETLNAGELDRLINNELVAIRALNRGS